MRLVVSIVFGFSLLVVFPLSAHARRLCDGAPDEYIMEPIQAEIVDADTGAPIKGVVVVAFWKVEGPRQYVKIQESVTDINGSFFFPGWGPMKRVKEDDECFLYDDPHLKIFKPGYKAWGGTNMTRFTLTPTPDGTFNGVKSKVRKSMYSGTTIKLEPFVLGAMTEFGSIHSGTLETRPLTEKDWCQNISFITIDFSITVPKFPLPKLVEAMREQKKLHPNCSSDLNLLEEK